MKKLLLIAIGFIIGALFMYSFLWWQVYQQVDKLWCQIYTGEFSVQMAEKCK